jgi:dienelactone hydrolase
MLPNFGRWWKMFAAVLGCAAIGLSALAQAPPPNAGAAGSPPREVVAVDPSVYDGYVGHYKFSDTVVMAVTRDGTHLFAQLTGQGALEIFPSSKTEYFLKVVPAQISFAPDARGRATALTLHQGGREITAPRIDDQAVAQIEQRAKEFQDAVNARVQSQTPMPGSEAALRQLFTGLLEGKPNYDQMSAQFAEVTRQQLGPLQASVQGLGAIQLVKFLSVTPQGMDSYEVHFEHRTANVQIMLSSDGKIQGALIPPPVMAGAVKAESGPYPATYEAAFGAPGLRVFRPDSLERISGHDRLPVVVWGNGGCTYDTPVYSELLSTIASHGFLVITTAGRPEAGAASRAATADDLKAAIDWAVRENARPGSSLKGKIETRRVAVMGQSCGGGLALELGADPRVTTIGVFNYGTGDDVLKKLRGPVLLINGHQSDFMMGPSKATYDAIANLPVFYGALHGVGHIGTVTQPGGGEFANVASNWALWQLKGDKAASAMFVGSKCTLCTSPNWDTQSKRLPN